MVSLLEEAKDSALVRRKIQKETIPNEGYCEMGASIRDETTSCMFCDCFSLHIYTFRNGVRRPAFLPTAGGIHIQRPSTIPLDIHVCIGSAMSQIRPNTTPGYHHDMQDEAIQNTAGLSDRGGLSLFVLIGHTQNYQIRGNPGLLI